MSEQANQARDGVANGSREPRAEEDAQHEYEHEHGPQGTSDAKSTHDARRPPVILVAEDDEPIAEAIALLLEDAGYRPALAANGREALEAARTNWPALVITDLMMPRMSGLELVEELRAIAVTNGHKMPPFVLMTAVDVAARRPEALGVDAVVPKPFDVTALEAMIRRLLGQALSE